MSQKDDNNRKDEKSLKLYIVRHGETEWNLIKKFQGQLDSPLTENGIKIMKDTGNKLKNIIFSRVYTSELGRAVKSAEIILNKNINYKNDKIEIKKMSELNEVYFGLWQELSHEEVFEKYSEEAENYFHNVKRYNAENIKAEKLKDALDRFLRGIEKILKNHKSGNILIVTHGTVLEMFINYVENKDLLEIDERKLVNNGDYKIFNYKNGKFSEEK
jgi:2,3-bisphosphoglycerate-dependent phosphoglycerate mutase